MATPVVKIYGQELILDLYECNPLVFNRTDLKRFFKELCELIGMQREDLHFWDYTGYPKDKKAAPPHLKGTSAIQFIQTSNITIHTLDDLRKVFINLFSCQSFPSDVAVRFCANFFSGKIKMRQDLIRQ